MNRARLGGQYRRRTLAVACLVLAFVDVTGAVFKVASGHHSIVRGVLGGTAPGAPRFLLMLSGLLLIAAAPGLLRAKRMAFVLALGAALASFALHPLRLRDPDEIGSLPSTGLSADANHSSIPSAPKAVAIFAASFSSAGRRSATTSTSRTRPR